MAYGLLGRLPRAPRASRIGACGGSQLRRRDDIALVAWPWPTRRSRASRHRDKHLIGRFRLFFLIVLGESVLTAGNAFTDEPFEVERLLALRSDSREPSAW